MDRQIAAVGAADTHAAMLPVTAPASWGAIIAGAVVATAVSLILFALGAGLGFASMSPWAGHGAGAGTLTVAAAIWLIVMQWVASIFGGYITGRLRTRWTGTHEHEIFFRDTANGLVMWAVSTVVVAALVGGTVSAGISGGIGALSNVASAGVQGAAQGGAGQAGAGGADSTALSYDLDRLFRAAAPTTGAAASGESVRDPQAEAGRIIVNDMATGTVPDADRTYLAGLVASRTGLSEADAEKRVDALIASANEAAAKVKAAADTARKDAAQAGIYTALSLLIGAFIASVSAALGGRLRDHHA
jgi:hypothetical protein